MNYLIDPRGQWFRWPSATLMADYGYPNPDFDFVGYATRNLGFVSLRIEENATFLQFRAGLLTPAMLAFLKPYLAKAVAKTPVGLVIYAGGWMEEAYIDSAKLLHRIDELAQLRDVRLRDPFISKQQRPRDWFSNAHQNLNNLFEIWRFAEGVYSETVQRFLDSSGLMERTLFLSGQNESNILIMQFGGSFTIYNSFPMQNTIGHRITHQPDKAYGRWVEQFYKAAWERGEPQIDDIDALISEPGQDLHRRRYQRLILRWQQPNGDVLLTGSSMLNQNISIPLDVATAM